MIATGDILVRNGTVLPVPLGLESDPGATGWTSVTNKLNGQQVAEHLATAGWTFFFMADKIRMTAFGFDKASMLKKALRRVVATVKLKKCNCLEIETITMHSFLGIPYVTISVHSRHIQQAMVFQGA
jgi:hypothetical protein